MLSENSNSKSKMFTFEEFKEPVTGEPIVLVQKKQSECQRIPFLKDFHFEPCYLYKEFQIYADAIRNFKVRKDDVWILSFPKTGTTILSNIVSQLTQGLDFTRDVFGNRNTYGLEIIYMNIPGKPSNYSEKMDWLNGLNSAPSQRIFKSHLPPQLLPVDLWKIQPKMIYISRNPKDVAISMYYMFRNIFNDKSLSFHSKEEYFDRFLNGDCLFGPYDTHVSSFNQFRSLDDFLFLTYEDLLADRFQTVKKISEFLECKYSDEDLEKLAAFISFDNMKQINEKTAPKLNFKARFVEMLSCF